MQEVGLNMLLRKNRCNVQLSQSILAENSVVYTLIGYNLKEGLDVESASGEYHFNSVRDFSDFLMTNSIVGVLVLDISNKEPSQLRMSDMPISSQFYYCAVTVIVYDDASGEITILKKREEPKVHVRPDLFGRTIVPSNPASPMSGITYLK